MKRALISLLLLCCLLTSAQENDSLIVHLESKIRTASTEALKLKAMLELGEYHLDNNFTKARYLIDDAYQTLQEEASESQLSDLANAMSLKGIVARREGDYVKSLDYYFKSKSIYEELQDSINISSLLHNIGVVHRYNKDPRKSIGFYQESIAIKNRIGNQTYEIACGYNMMGIAYKQLKRQDSALYYYHKAIELFASVNKKEDIYRAKNNIANIYRMEKQFDMALNIYFESNRYYKKVGRVISTITNYYNISTVYKDLKDYKTSMKYADSSLVMARAEGLKERISKAYLRKSYLFAKLDNYKEAYNYYRRFNRASDSIFNIENIKKIQELELNHKFEQERSQLEAEKKAVEVIAKSEAKEKKLYILLSVLALLSSGIIAFLVFKVYKTRALIIAEKLEKEEMQQALLHKKVSSKEEEIRRLIADNSMRLSFKEELLQQLKSNLAKDDTESLRQSVESMAKNIQAQIQTENKFSSLQSKIDEVNEGFDTTLRTMYPELSKTEREVCHLLRLNLSIKEMMIIRSASVDAIKSVRYRIRKKMGLTSKDELEKFIQNL